MSTLLSHSSTINSILHYISDGSIKSYFATEHYEVAPMVTKLDEITVHLGKIWILLNQVREIIKLDTFQLNKGRTGHFEVERILAISDRRQRNLLKSLEYYVFNDNPPPAVTSASIIIERMDWIFENGPAELQKKKYFSLLFSGTTVYCSYLTELNTQFSSMSMWGPYKFVNLPVDFELCIEFHYIDLRPYVSANAMHNVTVPMKKLGLIFKMTRESLNNQEVSVLNEGEDTMPRHIQLIIRYSEFGDEPKNFAFSFKSA